MLVGYAVKDQKCLLYNAVCVYVCIYAHVYASVRVCSPRSWVYGKW